MLSTSKEAGWKFDRQEEAGLRSFPPGGAKCRALEPSGAGQRAKRSRVPGWLGAVGRAGREDAELWPKLPHTRRCRQTRSAVGMGGKPAGHPEQAAAAEGATSAGCVCPMSSSTVRRAGWTDRESAARPEESCVGWARGGGPRGGRVQGPARRCTGKHLPGSSQAPEAPAEGGEGGGQVLEILTLQIDPSSSQRSEGAFQTLMRQNKRIKRTHTKEESI